MEELIKNLQKVIKGEVLSDEASLLHYSTDGSVFRMKPWAIVLPSSKKDIKNLVKWVMNQKKKLSTPLSYDRKIVEVFDKLSITCRGRGTDQTGGPVNEGIILRFPKYIDKILEIGSDFARVEPGVLWQDLNARLEKEQGRFAACFPASTYSSVGGGVANNCAGANSLKYGSSRDNILSLKMILRDGQEAEFRPLSEKEIAKKQSRDNQEGEIYRNIWDLLISNHNLIRSSKSKVNKHATGYWLYDLIDSEGGLNLTKLICGSQGTLGIITEITLRTFPLPQDKSLILASFDNLENAGKVVPEILKLGPSALEMVDKFLLEMTQRDKPEMIDPDVMDLSRGAPAITLLIEFDDQEASTREKKTAETKKILEGLASGIKEADEKEEQDKVWQVRRAAALVGETGRNGKKALPFIEDSVVNPADLAEYVQGLYKIFEKYQVEFSIWGHAGNGNIHVQPFLDLGKEEDKKKMFDIAREVYSLVIRMKGVISGEHNDGLMRSPFLKEQFGEPVFRIFEKVKEIFDPLNIFNPHKKIGVDLEFAKKYLRDEYELHI